MFLWMTVVLVYQAVNLAEVKLQTHSCLWQAQLKISVQKAVRLLRVFPLNSQFGKHPEICIRFISKT